MSVRESPFARLLGRLYSARAFGVRLDLIRIERLLELLGHPQERFRVRVQIGGTNGKGSTAAFVESMLRRAGARTGLFTSPHLSRLSERFCVQGRPLSDAALVEAGMVVARAAEEVAAIEPPTFFEQVTAMAVWAFAQAGVEVAVLEVGLGGRLDATTAVGADVAAVTGVAFDHENVLGTTIPAIAGEKAGIFRPGQRVVIGAAGEAEAVPILARAARRARAQNVSVVEDPARFVPESWTLGLAGRHQRANAACALAVVDELEALSEVRADGEPRLAGLASTRLPGRMEVLSLPDGRRVVVDGAHNPHAARAFAAALGELKCQRRIAVLGMCRGKDAEGIAEPLVANASAVIATRSRHDRSMEPEEVAAAVRRTRADLEVQIERRTAAAIDRARDLAAADDLVVVAGSLFVVGEAREHLCGVQADPYDLSDPQPVAERS